MQKDGKEEAKLYVIYFCKIEENHLYACEPQSYIRMRNKKEVIEQGQQ
jgi:hypothetical protein